MAERYIPPSDFLQAVINDEVPFGEDDFGQMNLAMLIAMTRDGELANRDWAKLLLAQLELNRPDVREALIHSAADENAETRGEAIHGLALLDRTLALPFVQNELKGSMVNMPLIEAAILVADASLVEDLEAFASPSDNAMLDAMVLQAIKTCSADKQYLR